jgi:hypothetical protein
MDAVRNLAGQANMSSGQAWTLYLSTRFSVVYVLTITLFLFFLLFGQISEKKENKVERKNKKT